MSKKYYVVKVEDVAKLTTEDSIVDLLSLDVEDAEVIRHQDITAGPIFSAYAHMIISYRDLLSDMGVTPRAYHTLGDIADHFHEASILAESCPHKRLPD